MPPAELAADLLDAEEPPLEPTKPGRPFPSGLEPSEAAPAHATGESDLDRTWRDLRRAGKEISSAAGYDLIARVPSTGISEIFLGRMSNPSVLRRAVLKRIQRGRPDYDAARDLLLEEARALGHMDHPNVVPLYQVVEDETGVTLVLGYVEGTDLQRVNAKLRSRGEALPFELASFIAGETLRGLHHAHTARNEHGHPLNIVHRDVHPGHVLIATTGHVRIADFSLGPTPREMDSPRTAPARAQIGYLPPESIDGRPGDSRSDIYAVGVMLFELLTGRPCFSGTPQDVLRKIANHELPLDRLEKEAVPPELRKVVVRATERDPTVRFTTAEEMANAIETWLMRSGLRASAWILSAFFGQHELFASPTKRTTEEVPRASHAPAAPSPASVASLAAAASFGASAPSHRPLGPGLPSTAPGVPVMVAPRTPVPSAPAIPVLRSPSVPPGSGGLAGGLGAPAGIAPSHPPNPPPHPPSHPQIHPHEAARMSAPPAAASRSVPPPAATARNPQAMANPGHPPPTPSLAPQAVPTPTKGLGVPPASTTAPEPGRGTRPPAPAATSGRPPDLSARPPTEPSKGPVFDLGSASPTLREPAPVPAPTAKRETAGPPPAPSLPPRPPPEPPEKMLPPWSGDLGETRASEVLGKLAEDRGSGTIEFKSGQLWKRVTFLNGRPIALSSNVGMEQVGEQLVRARILQRLDLDRAMRESHGGEDTLVERLVRLRLVDETQLRIELGRSMAERLGELFTWRQGTFEFTASAPVVPWVLPELDLAALIRKAESEGGGRSSGNKIPSEDTKKSPRAKRPTLNDALEMARAVASATKGRIDEIAPERGGKRKR